MATESMQTGSHGNRIDVKWKPWQRNREARTVKYIYMGLKPNVKVKSCFKKTWYFKIYNQGRN